MQFFPLLPFFSFSFFVVSPVGVFFLLCSCHFRSDKKFGPSPYLALSLHRFTFANPPLCYAACHLLGIDWAFRYLFSSTSVVLPLAYPPCSDLTTKRRRVDLTCLQVDFTHRHMCPMYQPVCLVSHALAAATVFWFCVFLLYFYLKKKKNYF
jgi:hypothetical protein